MHIGFLTSDLSHHSGWAHYSLSLLNALQRTGVQMTIITAQNSPDADGLTLHKLLPNLNPAKRYNLARLALSVPQVRKLLRDCDLIHVTAEPYAPLGAWVAGKRPLLLTGHGSYVRVNDFRRWPINRIYRRAFYRAQLVCVSRYTARIAQSILPGIQAVVVNNGVDAERFSHLTPYPSPPAGRGEMAGDSQQNVTPFSPADSAGNEVEAAVGEGDSYPKHIPTVLTVGGVKARKGTLELVRAIGVVHETLPEVQCIVIGSTDSEPLYTQTVRARIERLGLNDKVHLLGFVPETVLMEWYGKADVFVLPSINTGWKFEGYGLAHIEASAAGLPVIGTTNCGAEDAIDDGLTGLLVEQARVEDLLPGAILRLLTNKALAAQMGAAGREKASRQTWDHVAAQMLALYQAAVEAG